MGVGAVAEILEHVLFAGERRLPDPADAFRAHMGDGRGAAVRHRQRHAVTADAGHGAAALGDLGRGVVRAARAEIRRALQFCGADAFRRPVERFELCQTLLQRRAAMAKPAQPRDDGRRHHGRRQLAFAGQQRRAALVALADHRRPLRRIDIIENAQELVLDKAALLLDDQHILQTFGERPRAGFLQRPGQRDLVDAQSQRLRLGIGNAEIGQRLPEIEIGLAGRHDAEPRRPGIQHDAVEAVDARERRHRLHLRAVQPPLLLHRRVRPADGKPARRHFEIVGHDDLDAIGIADDRGRAFNGFGNRLEADPAT